LGDQAGQHEMIAENLSTSVVQELSTLVKQLKDDRRKVQKYLISSRTVLDRLMEIDFSSGRWATGSLNLLLNMWPKMDCRFNIFNISFFASLLEKQD
jgi:hypothetical protein